MRRLPRVSTILVLSALGGSGLAAPAFADPIRHDVTATSTATIEVEAGRVVMRTHSERLLPYVRHDGAAAQPRLAVTALDVVTRTDAEGADPDSRARVTVYDLSGATRRPLATIAAPGTDAALVGTQYVDVVAPGCCAAPDTHRVFNAETGKALFTATGPAQMGTTAWAEAPNAKPSLVRWAALDGSVSPEERAQGVLARLSYGSPEGALSTLALRAKTPADADALEMGLAHSAALVWLGGGADQDGRSGTADSPQTLWALDGVSDPKKIGGFQLAVVLDGRRLAVFPVAGDRLASDRASLAHDVALAPTR